MHVRLGFSVAAHMKPDILLMDEVLAVGDFRFQQKCHDKINQFREYSSTIFISHSMGSVRLFCDRVIVLDKGQLVFEGDPDEAIKFYMSEVEQKHNPVEKKKTLPQGKQFYGDLFQNDNKIAHIEHYWADKELNRINSAETGDEVNIIVRFQLKSPPQKELVIGIPIWNEEGTYITGISTDMNNITLSSKGDLLYEVCLHFKKIILNPGCYISVISIVDGLEFYYRGLNNVFIVKNYKRNFGLVTPNHEWIIN